MKHSMVFTRALVLTSLLTCSSCEMKFADSTSPTDQQQATPTSNNPPARELLWSPDEQFVYTIGSQGLQAVNVAGGTVTTLNAHGVFHQSLSLSGTGTSLYYLAKADSFSSSFTLFRYRRSDGASDTVLTDVGGYVASPVSDEVACYSYSTDTLVLYSPDTGVKRTIGRGAPYAYSPDGLDLLTEYPAGAYYPTISVFHLSDGSITPLTFDHVGYVRQFDWHANGLKAICMQSNEVGTEVYVYNITTGWIDTLMFGTNPGPFVFDATGERIGFWTKYVTDTFWLPLFGQIPSKWDFVANVYSLSSHSNARHTIGNSDDANAAGGLAFSPSGTRLACAYRGGVTIINVQ